MISSLDATLRVLLERDLPPELTSEDAPTRVTISFAPPDAEFPGPVSVPAIDLFLYDIRENRNLRSNEPIWEPASENRVNKRRPLVRVECSYLITAWAGTSGNPDLATADEHRILSNVMEVLMRYNHLPEEILQGRLSEQELHVPFISLRSSFLQSIGEFWQALGGEPRAALHCTVTISIDPFAPIRDIPVVTENVIDMQIGLDHEES